MSEPIEATGGGLCARAITGRYRLMANTTNSFDINAARAAAERLAKEPG